jgi:phosphoserine phosphatase RsbX
MIACGVASRALAGQSVCGDAHVIAPFPGGVLVAAVDGLGHGPEAAEASKAALEVITRCAAQPVTEIMAACHEALKSTRGAAVSLASFSDADQMMSWIAVGNVEAVLVRPSGSKPQREHLFLRGGIVGHNLPPPRAAVLKVGPNDTVILTTDGIRPGFAEGLNLQIEPEALAHDILGRCARAEDDALVLVARFSAVA